MILLSLISMALAHHDAPPSRLPTVGAAGDWDADSGSVRVDVGADLVRFRQVKSGWGRVDTVPGVVRFTQVATVAVRHRSGLEASVALPWVTSLASKRQTTGVGDAMFAAGWSGGDRVRGQVRALLTAPTGRSGAGDDIALIGVHAKDGSLMVMTTTTQTLPGLGVAAAGIGGGIATTRGRVEWSASGQWLVPLAERSDSIRWGMDVGAQTALGVQIGRFQPQIAGVVQAHSADRIAGPDASLWTANARVEAALDLSLKADVSKIVRCQVGAQIPMARWVHGTQVVGSSQGRVACSLRPRKAKADAVPSAARD
ncbi:MAG: hypothetical protein AB8H79_08030 [Myxococcota bacterium]